MLACSARGRIATVCKWWFTQNNVIYCTSWHQEVFFKHIAQLIWSRCAYTFSIKQKIATQNIKNVIFKRDNGHNDNGYSWFIAVLQDFKVVLECLLWYNSNWLILSIYFLVHKVGGKTRSFMSNTRDRDNDQWTKNSLESILSMMMEISG